MRYYDYITDFIFAENELKKADLIMIPGSGYGELALKAADLYHQGFAPEIAVSGRFAKGKEAFGNPVSPAEYTGRSFRTEAEFLSAILKEQEVPSERILLEERATFTYENAIYTRKLLEKEERYEKVKRMILVCQAFHAARSRMYFQYVFPDTEILMAPAVTQGITKDNWYLEEKKRMVVLGEVERLGTQFTDIMNGRDKIWKR